MKTIPLEQKAQVVAFSARMLLEQIYPRSVWPGAPDYENGDTGSILVKQLWLALEAYEKERAQQKPMENPR